MSLSASEIEYDSVLQQVVNSIKRDIDEHLIPSVNALKNEYVQDSWGVDIQAVLNRLLEKWSSPGFRRLADQLASRFVRTTLGRVDREQKRRFGIDVLQDSPQIANVMQAASIQNANLIKSIPEHYLEDVSNTVYTGMRVGLLPRDIAAQVQEKYGVTQRRAKFIARDQSAKINGELSKQRQIDAGYEFFQWVTAHDSRVRHSHDEISEADIGYGQGIYRWDDLPKNERGERIQPGSDYNCRCISRAVRNSVVRRNQERATA